MTKPIYNSLTSSALDVVALSDPSRVSTILATQVDTLNNGVAKQMQDQRKTLGGENPPVECTDLASHIVDIIVETSVQGASMLELHIADPAWQMFVRQKSGSSFIDVDVDGFLWPPIEITFPPENPHSTWRLCQAKPSTDLDQANIVLTFEDKIVSQLREHDQTTDPSCKQSNPNEPRANYIKRLIDTANKNPTKTITGEVPVNLVRLLPAGDFTAADLQNLQQNPPTNNRHGKGTPKGTPQRTGPDLTGFTSIAQLTQYLEQANAGIVKQGTVGQNLAETLSNGATFVPFPGPGGL